MSIDKLLYAVFPYTVIGIAIVGVVWQYFSRRVFSANKSAHGLEKQRLLWRLPRHYLGLLVILMGHLVGFLIPNWVLAWNGVPWRLYVLEIFALAFGFLALWELILLIVSRASDARVWVVTLPVNVLFWFVLLGQVATGLWTAIFYRWGSSWYAGNVVPYLWSILKFNPSYSLVSDRPWMVQFHILGAFALIGLLPYTRFAYFLKTDLGKQNNAKP